MKDRLYLFATINDTPVAVQTRAVEAVVRLPQIVPIAGVPAQVCGLAALRSRVLTVIDMRRHILGSATRLDAGPPIAIVMELAGHGYGLLVDEVHDICAAPEEVQPVRGRIAAPWRRFAHGLVRHEGRSHIVLNLVDFVSAGGGAQAA